MTYNYSEGTSIEHLYDLKNIKALPDNINFPLPPEWKISYSLNFRGDRKYTLENINDHIFRVIWKYKCCYKDDYTGNCECSCIHCGNGQKVLYIFELDKNYGVCVFWNGCLSYEPDGEYIISNSLTDLIDMCMTKEHRELFQNSLIPKAK